MRKIKSMPRLVGEDPLDEDSKNCTSCGNRLEISCAPWVICRRKPASWRGRQWLPDPGRMVCDNWTA